MCFQDWERVYVLAKARGMVDGARVNNKCPAATHAKTPEEAKRMRVEAAPLCLKGRVERDETLPEVEVGQEVRRKRGRASSDEGADDDDGEAYQQEVLRAVVGFVVNNLKAELVVELLQAIKP